jgi:hypothetical protein
MNTNESTYSKRWKTPEQKDAAAARNRANGALRASLHKQKATAGNSSKRAELQRQIDAIGAGKAN